MPRPVVALVSGLLSVAMLVVIVLAFRVVIGSTVWLETSRELGCQQDATASGYRGWCLERVSRPEALLVPGLREIRFVAQVDGGGGRMLSFDDPFPEDASLTIRSRESEIAVVDPADGTALVVSRDRIATLAD